MNDYNTSEKENQDDFDILNDVNASGKINDWKQHKINSLDVANTYRRIGYDETADLIRSCGTDLVFKEFADGSKKLHSANFCKKRLCQMCAWRRSKKIFSQVSKVMDALAADKEHNYRFVFLTLTIKNVVSSKLSGAITELLKGFNLLTKKRKFKKSVKGYFRALEVTFDMTHSTDAVQYFHPHIHCILTVPDYYFKVQDYYITQKEWSTMWGECLGVDYNPVVDVRTVKDLSGNGDNKKAVCEISKYAVKASDVLMKFDYYVNVKTKKLELRPSKKPAEKADVFFENFANVAVATLDAALCNRRLVAFGGIMKELHKKLNLDDVEDGDLVHVGDELDVRPDLAYILVKYSWHIGFMNYYRVGEIEDVDVVEEE